MPKHFNTRMRKHGRKFFGIRRQKFPGNIKSAILAGRRSQPRFKGIMDTLFLLRIHQQTTWSDRRFMTACGVIGVINFLVESVYVPCQRIAPEPLFKEGLHHKIRGTEQTVSLLVLGLLYCQQSALYACSWLRGKATPNLSHSCLDHFIGKPRMGVGPLQDSGDSQFSGRFKRP